METINEVVAENVRLRAKWAGVAHKSLAESLNMSEVAFSGRMTGKREWRLAELAKIAELLSCEVQAFFQPPREAEAEVAQALAEIEEIARAHGLGRPTFVARSEGFEPPTF